MDQDRYIGRLLDNRYEILEVIGVGGMAVVYKARCHRLNRLVAIKILKDEHARDEEFRRRFHAESQAVAMLSHPNIVSVYDVASTGDANYIVMELIDGITLKQYMEKKGILNWKETLHFAIQIAKALEHAHSRGIVHRDIKPHNVMVLKNGSVKVTDFGIARVMSKSNTLTKEALGSVHYISPEQAKGGRVDNRSDIYSLGVVMYEMITGRPPYDGESPVAVAIQHINGGAKMPSVLNPNIPGGLEQIIMKAMAHDPANRYNNATAMLYDMDEFRKDPTMLFYYDAEDLMPSVTAATTPGSVNRPAPQPPKTTAERVAAAKPDRPSGRIAFTGTGSIPGATRRPAERPAGQNSTKSRTQNPPRRRQEDNREEDRSRVVTIAVISCSVVAIVAIMIFLWTFLNGGWFETPDNKLVKVPSLLGVNYETIDSDTYRHLEIVLMDRRYSDQYGVGQIMSQEPASGEEVVKGTKVAVVVSLGEKPVDLVMIDLVDLELDNAKNWLKGQGVPENLILVREEYSTTIAAGKITRTEPAADEILKEGQIVTIWSSLGAQIVTAQMPNVVDLNYDDAVKKLNEAGFMDVKPEEVESMEPAGQVLKQSETRYIKIDVTTPIVLQISKGPETKKMLDVKGKTWEEAEKALTDAGFLDVYPEKVDSNEPEGTVIGQNVEPDTEIPVNESIVLQVSKGPKEETMPPVVNMTYEDALKKLTDMGFVTVTRNDVENDAEAGTVIGQSVENGTKVSVITEIVLDVSKGPKIVKMPYVIGKTYETAEAELRAFGFKNIKKTELENNAPAGQVLTQSVTKDTEVPVNTEIILEISKGPAAPVTVRKTVTVNLADVKPEPVEDFKFELRQAGECVFALDHCTQNLLNITLEGYGTQEFDIYLDDMFYQKLYVDFTAP